MEEVHKRGMRVIIDGVFNHCGSFNKWLDREQLYESDDSYEKGAFVSEDSPYHDFFNFIRMEAGRIILITMGGGGMIHCQNLITKVLTSYLSILCELLKMGISSIQCRWLASGCGSGSWAFREIQSQILERISKRGQRGESGGNRSCGALWGSVLVAFRRPMGHCDELRCVYGAGNLVFDRSR